jgi:NADPH:quinone reductase-like Zn-dependent oxidoreductase
MLNNSYIPQTKEVAGDGKIIPLIESRYSLDKTAEAMRYLNEGHAQGKIVINPR